ncbi:hypothetical protein CCACVL1_07025 [Corchorus capsularis]|uniref:Uncharacterized protein n=1 Tax=Corchorus capsularis TaxID=210143 RepID=A0A1R3JAC8_COCAP|nr:hypothetical protein CCACVL1_07025 [Corchorus capsularis]
MAAYRADDDCHYFAKGGVDQKLNSSLALNINYSLSYRDEFNQDE